ncbi:DUF3999 domain-containing protein [Pseudomonas sp. MWU16-30317]|uniref:DUF3999 domain-containing protein n=1 Tax=Pseudomonas sp. MWU16-30317 TaxID=2878095 RepID=UPI001CF9A18A|nr:DUF3999 domain-containing protein [Pseudomonas sp. MWU16-30317]
MGVKWWRLMGGLMAAWMSLQAVADVGQDSPKAADFSVQVPLGLSGEGPWYRLELPLALQLSARRSDTEDLRVFDAGGEPQAFALFRQQPTAQSRSQENTVHWFPLYDSREALGSAPSVKVQMGQAGAVVDVISAKPADAGKQVLRGWLIDTSAIAQPLTRLALNWAGEQDGFQRFSIEASDDLQHWQPWGEGQVARLSFANERVEQHEVTLPGRQARYLRLLWQSPVTAPTLSVVQVLSSEVRALAPALNWSAPLAGSATGHTGEYVWRLPAQLAVERLKLDLVQPNTLAPVVVSGRGGPTEPWRRLRSGLFYRLSQGAQESVEDEMPMAGEPLREVQIKVDERGGGLGTDTPTLRVAVRATEVVFLARGKAPFTLAIGNALAQPASLPLNILLAANPKPLSELGVARLAGTPMIAGGNDVAPAPATDWKRIALIAVLLLGVAVLAAMARSLLAKPS